MNDTEYEYQIAEDGRTVQVRPKRAQRRRPPMWSVYMRCDSENEAERILFLLQHPQFEGGVRP